MRNGLILMTALPPTRGHFYLIAFASRFMATADPDGMLNVIVFSRDCEPISGEDRMGALEDAYDRIGPLSNVSFHLHHGEVPQDPTEHPDFWRVWKDIIHEHVPEDGHGIVFASDHYGIDMAKALGAEFIPCNTYREIINISATQIRHDPFTHFGAILPEFQPQLKRTVTFFGAESTGKTTLSKLMASSMNGYWVPEWAREYMEVCSLNAIDATMMDRILHAQFASQSAVDQMIDKPFVMRDTDLLSTIGYYRIAGMTEPGIAHTLFESSRSDLYILTNDMIPFTPDRLRFGGDKRESTNAFWLKLLKEFGCNYHLLHASYRERQEAEVATVVRNDFLKSADGLGMFLRVNQEPLAEI